VLSNKIKDICIFQSKFHHFQEKKLFS